MQTAHDAIGTAGREPQRSLFLVATAAAKPSRSRPSRRQEHLTTAGRGTLERLLQAFGLGVPALAGGFIAISVIPAR